MSDCSEAALVSKDTEVQGADPTESETVDFWRRNAREHERKAKSNASAPAELSTLIESANAHAESTAGKVRAAEAEIATIPERVAKGLKEHFVNQFKIKPEDADLFLTATDPELLIKQADGLVSRMSENAGRNHVPREGNNPRCQPDISYNVRGFLREMFDNPD